VSENDIEQEKAEGLGKIRAHFVYQRAGGYYS
jgi:hypothetical protein